PHQGPPPTIHCPKEVTMIGMLVLGLVLFGAAAGFLLAVSFGICLQDYRGSYGSLRDRDSGTALSRTGNRLVNLRSSAPPGAPQEPAQDQDRSPTPARPPHHNMFALPLTDSDASRTAAAGPAPRPGDPRGRTGAQGAPYIGPFSPRGPATDRPPGHRRTRSPRRVAPDLPGPPAVNPPWRRGSSAPGVR